MELSNLQNEAMKLHPKYRAQLAKELLNSLEDLSPSEIEQLWADEAVLRNNKIDTGAVELRSSEKVMQDARVLMK
jgi:hypothetical protein